jgi:hypothetical protein
MYLKMKDEQINKIWYERKFTLDFLYYKVNMLLRSNKPKKQLSAVWRYYFDLFVNESFNQDERVRSVFDQDYEKKWPIKPIKHEPLSSRQQKQMCQSLGIPFSTYQKSLKNMLWA